MQETEIEVFRAGTPAARGITADKLAEVAAFDCGANPLPVCFGHPTNDKPAAGTISKLRADGNSLFATVKSFTSEAIEGIKSGAWLNRSFAFFDPTHEANPTPGKWAPRHLGLLGSSAPGIPGMTPLRKALAFNAADELVVDGDPETAVIFAGKPTPVHFIASPAPTQGTTFMTPEEIAAKEAEFAAREVAAKAREDAAAARIRTQFEASNGSAIDALVLAGKVIPAEVEGLKTAFNSLDPEADLLTFGAGDKATQATGVAHILAFMASALPKRVPIGDEQLSPNRFEANPNAPKTGAEFNAAADKLAKEKGITFEAAAEQLAG